MALFGSMSANGIRIATAMGAWTLVGLLLATQAWVSAAMRDAPIAWSQAAAIWMTWAGLWALLTPVSLRLAALFPVEHPHRVRALMAHVLFGALLSAVNLAAFATLASQVGATSAGPTWFATFARLLGTAFLLNVPVYWLIVGIAHALRLARSARERERHALQLETQLADARLLTLRAQLQPHFLFNSLNTIAVLMREDVDAADRTLVLLSNLLRRALESSAAQEVELGEEISFLELYLAIEATRFSGRLTYAVDVDPPLLDAYVPSLILQPLVENAVRHGLATLGHAGRIEITAARAGDDMLRLTVLDNGVGMNRNADPGFGLSNTRSRLALLYGSRHSFELDNARDGGLLASLLIPLRMKEPQ